MATTKKKPGTGLAVRDFTFEVKTRRRRDDDDDDESVAVRKTRERKEKMDKDVKKKKKKSFGDSSAFMETTAIANKGRDRDPDRKKKKKKLELVIANATPTTKITADDKKIVKSYFAGHSKKVMEMLKAGDTDAGMSILKKSLLMTVIRALPKAELILNQSGAARGTYQFVTLISQIRELITDIQADGDRKFLAQSVMETILKPAFMDLAQDMINDHHQFRKNSAALVRSEKSQEFSSDMQVLATNLATKMQKKYTEIGSKLEEALNG